MNISEKELKREKEYLLIVKKILAEIIAQKNKSIEYDKENINNIKKFMWDNQTDYTDLEMGAALYEVNQNVQLTNERIKLISKYEKAKSNPYFAKLVFKNNKYKETEEIYIGMCSIHDDASFYVFDWRAPISSLFYNYELGNAQYDTPGGLIVGEILTRMQIKIENGEIIRCFKSDINIDDDYLQEILSNSANEKMTNIVSTIQREQNEIIRNDKDKYLIVQGVAGSGKTSVALHRIAYLLYKDKNLHSNNILIFSPNNVFSDYISDVLPELGEENVQKLTFSEFASCHLKLHKKIENFSEYLDRIYSKRIFASPDIEYKMCTTYKSDLEQYIKDYLNNIDFGNGLIFGEKQFSNDILKKLFLVRYNKGAIIDRIEEISKYICSEAGVSIKKNVKNVRSYLLKKIGLLINLLEFYNCFLKSKGYNEIRGNMINYEDVVGLLYIHFAIKGFPFDNSIRQIVIDEAQDYTPFQIEILKKVFKNSSFTILGDINQTINPYSKSNTLESLVSLIPTSKYLELNKTYRSSEEIIEYSNKILGLNNVCSIRKNNNMLVDIKNVEKASLIPLLLQDINKMTKEELVKIAIITRDLKRAKTLCKMINDDESIQLISSSSSNVKKPIIIIPAYLSKGLEFDGAIICNDTPKDYDENEKNLYYVACTRAQHKLYIYNEPKKILVKQK
ncbi:MAG: AAA family ATPase [bacterium]|nr:AAA family ATPase [bacterium]